MSLSKKTQLFTIIIWTFSDLLNGLTFDLFFKRKKRIMLGFLREVSCLQLRPVFIVLELAPLTLRKLNDDHFLKPAKF